MYVCWASICSKCNICLVSFIQFRFELVDLIETLPYELEDEESTPIEYISTKAISPATNVATIKQQLSDYQLSGGSGGGGGVVGGGGIMIADSSAIDSDAMKSRNISAPVTPATTKGNYFRSICKPVMR